MEAVILPCLTSPIRSCKIASKNIAGVKANFHMEKAMLISLRLEAASLNICNQQSCGCTCYLQRYQINFIYKRPIIPYIFMI